MWHVLYIHHFLSLSVLNLISYYGRRFLIWHEWWQLFFMTTIFHDTTLNVIHTTNLALKIYNETLTVNIIIVLASSITLRQQKWVDGAQTCVRNTSCLDVYNVRLTKIQLYPKTWLIEIKNLTMWHSVSKICWFTLLCTHNIGLNVWYSISNRKDFLFFTFNLYFSFYVFIILIYDIMERFKKMILVTGTRI